MEYNEKLSHLTPDQIDDIVRMYSDKTFKVADIIKMSSNMDNRQNVLVKAVKSENNRKEHVNKN